MQTRLVPPIYSKLCASLVPQPSSIDGESRCSLLRASWVVHGQSIRHAAVLRWLSQAAPARVRGSLAGIRRARHGGARTRSAVAAML